MKYFAGVIFLIFVFLTLCRAAPAERGSEDCVYPQINLIMRRGEERRPIGKCMRLECLGHGVLYAEPCPGKLRNDCEVGESDLTQEFPYCCPEIRC